MVLSVSYLLVEPPWRWSCDWYDNVFIYNCLNILWKIPVNLIKHELWPSSRCRSQGYVRLGDISYPVLLDPVGEDAILLRWDTTVSRQAITYCKNAISNTTEKFGLQQNWMRWVKYLNEIFLPWIWKERSQTIKETSPGNMTGCSLLMQTVNQDL